MEDKEYFMRMRDVEQKTAMRKSKIYSLIKDGEFPAPIPLTPRSRAWIASEVDGWIRAKIAASRQGQAA